MILDGNIKECSNCGAVMKRNNFVYHCEYCNYIQVLTKDDKEMLENQHFISESSKQYEYILKNQNYIQQYPFVVLKKQKDFIRIKSNPKFYANDFHFHKIDNFSLWYIYENNKKEEHLYIAVEPKEHLHSNAVYWIILLNECKYIDLKLSKIENGISYFELDKDELSLICNSRKIDISCNMIICKINFFELLAYSCRFFSLVFDKDKYRYSLNLKLLID